MYYYVFLKVWLFLGLSPCGLGRYYESSAIFKPLTVVLRTCTVRVDYRVFLGVCIEDFIGDMFDVCFPLELGVAECFGGFSFRVRNAIPNAPPYRFGRGTSYVCSADGETK